MKYLVLTFGDDPSDKCFPLASPGDAEPVTLRVTQRITYDDVPDPDHPGFMMKREAPPIKGLGTVVMHESAGRMYTAEYGEDGETIILRLVSARVPDEWCTPHEPVSRQPTGLVTPEGVPILRPAPGRQEPR